MAPGGVRHPLGISLDPARPKLATCSIDVPSAWNPNGHGYTSASSTERNSSMRSLRLAFQSW